MSVRSPGGLDPAGLAAADRGFIMMGRDVIVGAAGAKAGAPQQWLYHSTVTSFQCSTLHPLPAPAAAPLTSFNPSLPMQLDLDALLLSDASKPLLQQHMVCQGQQLPEPAWQALLQVTWISWAKEAVDELRKDGNVPCTD
eukprot:gene2288-2598_t